MAGGNRAAGHLAAGLTVFLWGTTFISTKILLEEYAPIEILFTRFLIGFAALSLACGARLRFRPWREERLYMAAGLCGVTLYFLFENIALTYTYASHVSMVLAVTPMLTALASRYFLGTARVGGLFFAGFLCALCGIALITGSGAEELQLNPFGDFLAAMGALVWAVYSIFTRKIGAFGEAAAVSTRHIFFYGLLFMVPALWLLDFRWGFERLADPVNLGNLLFLGLGASALCFATWTYSVRLLGPVYTSVYLYAGPVITVACAVAVLGETITAASGAGIVLVMAGLFLSELAPVLSGRRT